MGIHAAMEGVCDTPLHLFDQFTGNAMDEWSKMKQQRPT